METSPIAWKYLDTGGRTCDRCAETGARLRRVIGGLTRELAARDIRVTVGETLLSDRDIPQSHTIFFNGMPLESPLPGAHATEAPCVSCSDLCGWDTSCRAIRIGDVIHETLPEFMIRQAAFRALGLEAPIPVLAEPASAWCARCE